jgi:hypothetical protein
MSRTLNKLTYKYKYLKIELEELEEEVDKYTTSFNSIFGKFFVDRNSEFWVNEETGEIRKDIPKEEPENKKKNIQPERLKKMYKKLSTVTHPDKGGSSEEFYNIKNAYNEGNILELLTSAAKYDIEYDYEPEDETLILQTIDKVSNKISGHKNSLAYNFFTGPKEKRLGVINEIQRLYQLKFTQEEIQNFLDLSN